MLKVRTRDVCAAILFTLVLASSLAAQTGTGIVDGRVLDAQSSGLSWPLPRIFRFPLPRHI
jgi:hypothetical protein